MCEKEAIMRYNTFLRDHKFRLNEHIHSCKHFIWAEALWLNSIQAYAMPTQKQIFNIIKTARALDVIRDYYNKPIEVTSWLRPKMYNTAIGGALKSAHLSGIAVDFVIKGIPSSAIREDLKNNKKIWPGRLELNNTPHVHVDLAGTRSFRAK